MMMLTRQTARIVVPYNTLELVFFVLEQFDCTDFGVFLIIRFGYLESSAGIGNVDKVTVRKTSTKHTHTHTTRHGEICCRLLPNKHVITISSAKRLRPGVHTSSLGLCVRACTCFATVATPTPLPSPNWLICVLNSSADAATHNNTHTHTAQANMKASNQAKRIA